MYSIGWYSDRLMQVYRPSLGLVRRKLLHVLSLALLVAAHSVLLFFYVNVVPMIGHVAAEREGCLCLMAG
jgi:hypothetical protein